MDRMITNVNFPHSSYSSRCGRKALWKLNDLVESATRLSVESSIYALVPSNLPLKWTWEIFLHKQRIFVRRESCAKIVVQFLDMSLREFERIRSSFMIEFNVEELKDIITVFCNHLWLLLLMKIYFKIKNHPREGRKIFENCSFLIVMGQNSNKKLLRNCWPWNGISCCCRGDGHVFDLVMFILLWLKREANMPNLNSVHGLRCVKNCQ